MHEVLIDEMGLGKSVFTKAAKKVLGAHGSYFLTDGNAFSEYFCNLILKTYKKIGAMKQVNYMSSETADSFWDTLATKTYESFESSYLISKHGNLIFFVDCCDEKYKDKENADKVLEVLKKCLKKDSPNVVALKRIVVVPLISKIQDMGIEAHSIAEREFDYYLSHKKDLTYSEKLYLDIEEMCRVAVRDDAVSVKIVRFDNIFGPEIDHIDGFSLKKLITDAAETGKIVVEDSDDADRFSMMYMRDAAFALFAVIGKGKRGHVYNAAGAATSLKDIKVALQSLFKEQMGIEMKVSSKEAVHYHCMNILKLRRLGYKPKVKLGEALYRTAIYSMDVNYDMKRKLGIYSGRLEKLKSLELETLKFVDQVCRENGIQYFLAGGSLLGAVRHQSIIPWDDDLDIGMLREDFEKFRQVCPGLVPSKFTYESPQDNKGSHYQFDKIRLKNTYFSTNYSSHFPINDGVFLDVIIYDQTSNNKKKTKRHIFKVRVLTYALNVKWLNKARKNKHYKLTKYALPILRKIPFPVMHKWFEKVLRKYEHLTDAKYLIDGIGQNIKKGRFPKEWLTEVKYVDYSGMQAPIPVGYDGYLRHFYGDRYMELLPISKRVSGHRIARIDLGGYLFDDDPNSSFRDVDIRGELYEKDFSAAVVAEQEAEEA